MKSGKVIEKGFWWVPERPENRLVGTISYSRDDGAEVDLIGTLLPIHRLAQMPEPFNVWGTTVANKEITLFRAYQANAQLHMLGTPTSKIESFRGVAGKHYHREEDVIVRRITCDIDYL